MGKFSAICWGFGIICLAANLFWLSGFYTGSAVVTSLLWYIEYIEREE